MNPERMYQVILGPHVSEKSAMMTEVNNQYVFKVAIDASKPEIKEAVEAVFKVVVSDLQVLNARMTGKKPMCVSKPAMRSTSRISVDQE
jgi:large subunit ribosomal protein L23